MKMIFTITLLYVSFSTFGQQTRTVTGRLTDREGNGLPGVSIVVKGTMNGTSTDADGNYSMEAPIGSTLVFSFIGMQTQEMIVTADNLRLAGNQKSPDIKSSRTEVRKIKTPVAQKSWPAALLNDTTTDAEGVAVLDDKTPTYSHNNNYLDGNSIVSIRQVLKNYFVKTNSEPRRTGFSLQLITSVNFETVGKLPELQNNFIQGRSLNGTLEWQGADQNELFSWGPSYRSVTYDGSEYDFDKNGRLIMLPGGRRSNFKRYDATNLFRTGTGYSSELTVALPSIKRSALNLSYRRKSNAGIIPGSTQIHDDASISIRDVRFSDRLKFDGRASYFRGSGNLLTHGANLAKIFGSMLSTPISFDNTNALGAGKKLAVDAYQIGDGSMRSHAPQFVENPYGFIGELPDNDNINRYTSSVTMKYDASDKFRITSMSAIDRQQNLTTFGFPPGFAANTEGLLTFRSDEQKVFRQSVAPGFDSWINDMRIKLNVNYNLAFETHEVRRKDGQGFSQQGWSDINSASIVSSRESQLIRTTSELIYNAEIERYWLTLKATHKNYWTSTASNKSFRNMFPSLSAVINLPEILYMYPVDLLKVYASFSSTLREAPLIYSRWGHLSTKLSNEAYGRFYESGELLFRNGLSPEIDKKFEAGIEAATSRFRLDAHYFSNQTENFIAPVENDSWFEFQNVGTIRNNGYTLTLSYQSYHHSVRFWSALRWLKQNSVVENLQSTNDIVAIAGFSNTSSVMMKGKPFGAIYGTAWLRNEEGRLVIDDAGYPMKSPDLKIIGNPIPDWTLSSDNHIKYGRMGLAIVVNYQRGGDRWNGTRAALDYLGRSSSTGKQREVTSFIFEGASFDGSPNDVAVNFYDHSRSVYDNRWVRYGYGGVAESYIEDASFFRLSEIAFTYTTRFGKKDRIQCQVSLVGRNVLLISNYNGVDPATNLFGLSSGSGLDMFNLPTTRSISAQVSFKI